MSKRIDNWEARGGNRAHLWQSVKGAQRLEGVVALVPPVQKDAQPVSSAPQGPDQSLEAYRSSDAARAIVQPAQSRIEREADRLRAQVEGWIARKHDLKQELVIINWRTRLLTRASQRADLLGECGWDQRMCYGDEEWEEFGQGVLESYDERPTEDDELNEEFGQWWCPAPKKCNRHAGYMAFVISLLSAGPDLLSQMAETSLSGSGQGTGVEGGRNYKTRCP